MAANGGAMVAGRPYSSAQPASVVVNTGTQLRPAEELLTALRKGSNLLKYGRRGKPKYHWFRLSADDKALQWENGEAKVRSVLLLSVKQLQQGQRTSVFQRYLEPALDSLSFSLIYRDGSKDRSLDLVCTNPLEFETWFSGLQLVFQWLHAVDAPNAGRIEYAHPAAPLAAQSVPAPVAHGGKAPVPARPTVTAQVMGGGQVQGRVSGVLGFPAKREIGDCYIWGSLESPLDTNAAASSYGWQSCCTPEMVNNSTALDIVQVACGPRHAALVTRGGKLYTWGDGARGGLGHGTGFCASAPQQVSRLFSTSIKAISCGHTSTSAITTDGSLYAWGDGTSGQLGHGGTHGSCWPLRVSRGLEGVRLEQLSCGPFHTAAVSRDGHLFTWGDGAFGKLGHGGHGAVRVPQPVAALAEQWVISVACGWWHTAAAAVPRSSMPRTAAFSMDSALDGSRAQQRALGGALYTWGGDFSWEEPPGGEARGKPAKRDHHRGCLGLRDLEGRQLPTVVGGELADAEVCQVAAGLNFTVALTNDGRAFQMGSTGAFNSTEGEVFWEGAKMPVQVRGTLELLFAERVSAGASHVAVVASRKQSNGRIVEESARSRLMVWGRGGMGQLGLGSMSKDDHSMPQIVTAIDGRRILHVACGGHHTLAVCEHDPRFRPADSRKGTENLDRLRTQTVRAASTSNLLAGHPGYSPAGGGGGGGSNALAGSARAGGTRAGSGATIPHSNSANSRLARDVDYAAQHGGAGGGTGGTHTSNKSGTSYGDNKSRFATITKNLLSRSTGYNSRPESASSQQQAHARRSHPASLRRMSPGLGDVSGNGTPTSSISQIPDSMLDYQASKPGTPVPESSQVSITASHPSNLSFTPHPPQPSGTAGTADAPTLRQMKYWQERASHLEQQLNQRTVEVEYLRTSSQRTLHDGDDGAPSRSRPTSLDILSVHGEPGSPHSPGSIPTSPYKSVPSASTSTPFEAHATAAAAAPPSTSAGAPAATSGHHRSVSRGLSASFGGWWSSASNLPASESSSNQPVLSMEDAQNRLSHIRTSTAGGAAAAALLSTVGNSGEGRPSSAPTPPGAEPVSASTSTRMRHKHSLSLAELPADFAAAARTSLGVAGDASMLPAQLRSLGSRRLSMVATSDDVISFVRTGSSGGSAAAASPFALTAAAKGSNYSPNATLAVGGGGGAAVASATDPEQLRSENERLLQQVAELQARLVASQNGSPASPGHRGSPFAASPAASPAVAAIRGANRHRRAMSIDVAALSVGGPAKKSFVQEVEPGVFLTLEPLGNGQLALRHARFAKPYFDKASANVWWAENLERIKEQFNMVLSSQPSSPAAHSNGHNTGLQLPPSRLSAVGSEQQPAATASGDVFYDAPSLSEPLGAVGSGGSPFSIPQRPHASSAGPVVLRSDSSALGESLGRMFSIPFLPSPVGGPLTPGTAGRKMSLGGSLPPGRWSTTGASAGEVPLQQPSPPGFGGSSGGRSRSGSGVQQQQSPFAAAAQTAGGDDTNAEGSAGPAFTTPFATIVESRDSSITKSPNGSVDLNDIAVEERRDPSPGGNLSQSSTMAQDGYETPPAGSSLKDKLKRVSRKALWRFT